MVLVKLWMAGFAQAAILLKVSTVKTNIDKAFPFILKNTEACYDMILSIL